MDFAMELPLDYLLRIEPVLLLGFDRSPAPEILSFLVLAACPANLAAISLGLSLPSSSYFANLSL